MIGALTPSLSRRFGVERLLVAALVAMTAGLILRAFAGNAAVFFACSVLALAGGAIGNVTMPTLVKQYFPHQLGRMSSAYTTSMAIGQTLAAGLSVRASALVDPASWRVGIGVWALLAFLAIVPWVIIGASPMRWSISGSTPPTPRHTGHGGHAGELPAHDPQSGFPPVKDFPILFEQVFDCVLLLMYGNRYDRSVFTPHRGGGARSGADGHVGVASRCR